MLSSEPINNFFLQNLAKSILSIESIKGFFDVEEDQIINRDAIDNYKKSISKLISVIFEDDIFNFSCQIIIKDLVKMQPLMNIMRLIIYHKMQSLFSDLKINNIKLNIALEGVQSDT